MAYFVLLYQGRLLVYVENTHTKCVPYFTSFLTVPPMTGSVAHSTVVSFLKFGAFAYSNLSTWGVRDIDQKVYYFTRCSVGVRILRSREISPEIPTSAVVPSELFGSTSHQFILQFTAGRRIISIAIACWMLDLSLIHI